MHNLGNVLVTEILMPRFYFNLASKDAHISDDSGKELDTLNDAYEHARKLIHKILFHVGREDAEAWKVVVSNDDHDAQMIIPFSVSNAFSAQRRRKK
jgi:precorrin-6x reductase